MNLVIFSSLYDSIATSSSHFPHLFYFLTCISNTCWTLAIVVSSLTCALFAFFTGIKSLEFGMEIAAVCTDKIPFLGTISNEGQQSVEYMAI